MGMLFALLQQLATGARRRAGGKRRSASRKHGLRRNRLSRVEPLEQRALLSISGQVFADLNGDGIKNPATEAGVAGWVIQLNDGTTTQTAVSDDSGNYSFPTAAGTYTISETPKAGWRQTMPLSPGTRTVTLADGEDAVDQDFGNQASVVTFGTAGDTTDGLDPASDTGIDFLPATHQDRITYIATPTFVGTASPGDQVQLYVDMNANGTVDAGDVLLHPQSNPLQDFVVTGADSAWTFAVAENLSTLTSPIDGQRTLLAKIKDAGPEVTTDSLTIFVDTTGPQISGITFGETGQSVFGRMPTAGMPSANTIEIAFLDQPVRTADFASYAAVNLSAATNRDNYHLTYMVDSTPVEIPISQIRYFDLTKEGTPGVTVVRLYLDLPNGAWPDSRFTLNISDAIVNDAGLKMDGEATTTSSGPDTIQWPTGDGTPGGPFGGEFIIDALPEIGVAMSQAVQLDLNGNFVFDPLNPDPGFRDAVYVFAKPNDMVFTGKFTYDPDGTSDNFDKLAAYGRVNNVYRWMFDTNSDGIGDVEVVDPKNIAGIPVAGNFDNNPINGDEVGVFTGVGWWLDTNHDFKVDTYVVSRTKGYPIVGDFNGDGIDDFATFQADKFYFDYTDIGQGIVTVPFGFPGTREIPVAGDMDGDGIDDFGLWFPDRGGKVASQKPAEWYFMYSGGLGVDQHAFYDPVYYKWGSSVGTPLVGNFTTAVDSNTMAAVRAATTIQGTAAGDTFELVAGVIPGSWTLRINGVAQKIDPKTTSLRLDGLGGSNTLIITGSTRDETVEAAPDHVNFRSGALTITASHFTTTTIIGGGGNDQALLYDSPGVDNLVVAPGTAKLTGKGYSIAAQSFANVQAFSKGGYDTAQIYRGTATGKLSSGASAVVLNEAANANRLAGFARVQVFSNLGAIQKTMVFKTPPAAKPVVAPPVTPPAKQSGTTKKAATPPAASAPKKTATKASFGSAKLTTTAPSTKTTQIASRAPATKATTKAADMLFGRMFR